MRIIWHSNAPFTNSAYGIQTALFVPRIAGLGHEVVISSPHSFAGSPLDWNGFQIIPAAGDVMGNDIIAANYQYYRADLLITLCDVFGLGPSAPQLAGINVAHWTPVDCDPLGGGDLAVLRDGMGIPIAMTRFGQRVMENEGLDPFYVPHGLDTKLYAPGKREEVRATMAFGDAFIIGICAMNRDPVRKGLVEQIMAFRLFWENHPDSKLMVHASCSSDPGLHLDALVSALGFPADTVMFPDRYSLSTGLISNEAMAAWFCSLDLLSACSYGEGFGMPVLEAQACGVPVVVTDFSGTGELCFSGWRVQGKKHWVNGHHSWWRRPEVEDIAAAYEEAWEAARGRIAGLAPGAREKALAYDADAVTEKYWAPVLGSIEADLKGG